MVVIKPLSIIVVVSSLGGCGLWLGEGSIRLVAFDLCLLLELTQQW